MNASSTPTMAHITGLVTQDGLGLIRCERCREPVDATDACVGTVMTADVDSSVLLCPTCADDGIEVRAWLVDHLTGPHRPQPGCQVA